LKELNYDVAEYEQEMQKYEFFSEKYKDLYDRRNLQTVFYNYYLPFVNKFGLPGATGAPDVSNADIIEQLGVSRGDPFDSPLLYSMGSSEGS
jgi:hypothetical protein